MLGSANVQSDSVSVSWRSCPTDSLALLSSSLNPIPGMSYTGLTPRQMTTSAPLATVAATFSMGVTGSDAGRLFHSSVLPGAPSTSFKSATAA